MKKLPDIDIDFANRDKALQHLDYKIASMDRNGTRVKHNTGIYVQDIPSDHTGLSTIDYERAEELGYFKLDFLNVSLYNQVKDKEHLDRLMNTEPVWQILYEKNICVSSNGGRRSGGD